MGGFRAGTDVSLLIHVLQRVGQVGIESVNFRESAEAYGGVHMSRLSKRLPTIKIFVFWSRISTVNVRTFALK